MPAIGHAKRIAIAIKKGELRGAVSITEIRRKRYAGTDESGKVREALELLADHEWLSIQRIDSGGRPAGCLINPRAKNL